MMTTTIEYVAASKSQGSKAAFRAGIELDFIACDIGNLAAVARLASTAEPLDETAQRALAGIADMAEAIAKRAEVASSRHVERWDHAGAQAGEA